MRRQGYEDSVRFTNGHASLSAYTKRITAPVSRKCYLPSLHFSQVVDYTSQTVGLGYQKFSVPHDGRKSVHLARSADTLYSPGKG